MLTVTFVARTLNVPRHINIAKGDVLIWSLFQTCTPSFGRRFPRNCVALTVLRLALSAYKALKVKKQDALYLGRQQGANERAHAWP